MMSRMLIAGPLRLLQRLADDLLRDAGDLDVHLQRGDAVTRAGDLEVHVAEVILGALDVGQDRVVVALLDEAHGDAGDRRLDRHAGVHQRERRPQTEAMSGAVRLQRLRHDADRVREVLRGRDHRLQGPLCQGAVADVAPLRAAHEARLPDRVGREVVVVHVAAILLQRQVVDPLALLGRAEGERAEDLRLAAREQAGAVRARVEADLERDSRMSSVPRPSGALALDGDLLADQILVDRLRGLLDVALRERVLHGLAVGAGAPAGNGRSTVPMMRSKSSERFADFSSFESCSASVRPFRSSSNCERTASTTASSRCCSSSRVRLERSCSCFWMSSSVESIDSSGPSSISSSSTIAPASFSPTSSIRSRIAGRAASRSRR